MEKSPNGTRTFNPLNRIAWREWLAANHTSTEPVALIIYGKKSSRANLSIADAVEEALCFGWIDNLGRNRDKESMYLQFTPRKEKSNWSMVNRDRALKMIRAGLMTDAGKRSIDLAKKSGKWSAALKAHLMPKDLKTALDKKKIARKNFKDFSPSSQKIIFQWINEAKQPETREARIDKTVLLAAKNIKAKEA